MTPVPLDDIPENLRPKARLVPLDDIPENLRPNARLVPSEDVPDDLAPVRPQPPKKPPQFGGGSFPQDEPGYTYGAILPMRAKLDAQGNAIPGSQELAFPELIRSPVRGVIEGGKILTGAEPFTGNTLPPDVSSAAGLAVLPLRGVGDAAATLGADVRAAAAANNAIKSPITREQASKIAADIPTQVKANTAIERRLEQDMRGQGTTAQDVVDKLTKGRNLGKPVTLMDVGGPNVHGLAGQVYRKPGESKAIIKSALENRDLNAANRLKSDLGRDLVQGPSAYRTQEALLKARKAEAQPLYDKAYEGGSIAPLEKQFSDAFDMASKSEKDAAEQVSQAQRNLTMVSSRHLPSDNIYDSARGNVAVRQAKAQQDAALKAQEAAGQQKQTILQWLHQAQEDRMMDAPGAVWNPRIQQFLDDPIVKRGMVRGREIQRLEALAQNTRFDPTEWAAASDGTVIKVPNMRVLDAGKQGLDAIIESEGRDEFGRLNQYGRAVDEVRKAYLSELDAVNRDYAEARAAWSGKSASLDAVKFGRNYQKLTAEQIADELKDMTLNDREFARLGAADSIVERISKTGIHGDEAKALVKNEWAKGQLRPFFRSEDDFQRLVDSVNWERNMFETKYNVTGNSKTAEREAEDTDRLSGALHAARSIASGVHGNFIASARSMMRAARDLGIWNDKELNEAIARRLADLQSTPNVVNGKISVARPPIPPGANQ